jgi:hypothetical protein
MSLFECADDSHFKCGIHGAALVLALEMGTYNAIVWTRRGTRWHLGSALIYGALAAFELIQVSRHIGEP